MSELPFRTEHKLDVHTHTTLSPDTFHKLERFAGTYANFVRVKAHETKPCCAQMVNGRGEVVRVIEDNAYDAGARLRSCDCDNVTVQVLSPTPMMIPDYVDNGKDAAEICKILNDDNLRFIQQFPQRFVALGAVPMRFPDLAIKEMERIKLMGMRGIEINSNVNGEDLDSPEFYPVFEAAAELDLCIFLHPWGGFMMPQEETLKRRMHPDRNWRPWLVAMPSETALAFDALLRSGVHERLPHLRVLYAHGGGAFPALLGRLEHGAYCRPDLFAKAADKDAWQVVQECGVYTDTLTHNPWALKMLVDILGSKRIAVGSDFPYPLGEVDPFDCSSLLDPKGNRCPYSNSKKIYPGHMVEHLPSTEAQQEEAWRHFNWLPQANSDGSRSLPLLSHQQKENILFRTGREWLGFESRIETNSRMGWSEVPSKP